MRENYEVVFPVTNEGFPDGKVTIVFTSYNFGGPKDDGQLPVVVCPLCGEAKLIIHFLRPKKVSKEGRLIFGQGASCHRCVPVEPFELPYPPLKIGLDDIRYHKGEPLRFFDRKSLSGTRRWRAASWAQFRMMQRPGPEVPAIIRMQPRSDRS